MGTESISALTVALRNALSKSERSGFIVFEKGSNMLDYHEKNKPSENEMWILYEKDSDTNSNLFGSFVLVKMGDGYFKYLRDLKRGETKIFSHIGESPKGIIIDSFEKEVNENYKALLKRTKQISKETFLFALETEMRTNSDEGKLLKSIYGGIDGIITSVAEGINSTIEEVKFTKEDYTPVKKEGDFNLADFLDKFIEVNELLLEKAVDYAVPDTIKKPLAKSFDDFVRGAKQLAKEKLAPQTILFFEKAYEIFQEIVNFFKEAATFYTSLVGDTLYLVKAFLMGVINGLLSTIQMIVSLVGWLLKGNIDKKLTGQFYLEIHSKFEFIEDLMDLISESIGDVFTSIKNLISDFSLEKFKGVLSIFKDKAGEINRFDVAYFAGIFMFEVLLGVALTIFTGGAAAVAEAANAAEKIAAYLKIFGREVLSTATLGIVDILKLFKTLILKFAQACQKGWKGFKQFLEKLFKNNVDDVVESEGKVLDNIIGDGLYGGKILSEADIEDWAKVLKKKFGTALKKVDNFENPNILAQFDANTNTILYKENVTEYFMAHESFHAEEMHKIGFDEYVKDAPIKKDGIPIKEEDLTPKNLIRRYKREKYVYNRLKNDANKFNLNGQERWHIEAYFYEIELSLLDKNIKIPK